MEHSETRKAWRLAELANLLGVSHGFLRTEIRRRKLTARKCGRAVLILESDLNDYLEQRRLDRPSTPEESPAQSESLAASDGPIL